jgi:hypothetical protein
MTFGTTLVLCICLLKCGNADFLRAVFIEYSIKEEIHPDNAELYCSSYKRLLSFFCYVKSAELNDRIFVYYSTKFCSSIEYTTERASE